MPHDLTSTKMVLKQKFRIKDHMPSNFKKDTKRKERTDQVLIPVQNFSALGLQ